MSKNFLGYMMIIISIVFPTVILLNTSILSPELNIIGVDGIIISKAIIVMCISLILSRMGFYLLSRD